MLGKIEIEKSLLSMANNRRSKMSTVMNSRAGPLESLVVLEELFSVYGIQWNEIQEEGKRV